MWSEELFFLNVFIQVYVESINDKVKFNLKFSLCNVLFATELQ